MKQKNIYIGGKAGDANFISQRKQLDIPGPIAGIGGETTKCLWCGKLFDGIMAFCGTGTTWSLYRCPHCKKLTAEGNIIPNVVKTDPMIKIMDGSRNVAMGETALSGSPERDACYSFLGKEEAKKRKKPIPELERFVQAKDKFIKNLFLYFEIAKLRAQFGLIIATPAKEIKKMKLRQIIKECKNLKDKIEEE